MIGPLILLCTIILKSFSVKTSNCRFDETFDMILPAAFDLADSSPSAFVHLCVKDRGVMGEGIFLGEAYLPLKSIEQADMDVVLAVRK